MLVDNDYFIVWATGLVRTNWGQKADVPPVEGSADSTSPTYLTYSMSIDFGSYQRGQGGRVSGRAIYAPTTCTYLTVLYVLDM